MSLFILIGFTGSELVVKYLNKIKQKAETIMNEGTGDNTNINENMSTPQFEYFLNYKLPDTKIEFNRNEYTPSDFAEQTSGVVSDSTTEIVWETQPSFTTVTLLFSAGGSQIAGPVRRPKGN